MVVCQFCDIDFVGMDGFGGGCFVLVEDLVGVVKFQWFLGYDGVFVVLMGGEFFLQFDDELFDVLYVEGFEVVVEMNGMIEVFCVFDWICVSLKVGVFLRQCLGYEFKFVFFQVQVMFEVFEDFVFEYFFLQLMDGDCVVENI